MYKKIWLCIINLIKYYYYRIYVSFTELENDDVWLISERGHEARDNAYVFYSYIKKNHPEVNVKYIIDKFNNDYKKIHENDIVIFNSKEHWSLFLTSGVLISTHDMGFSPYSTLFNNIHVKIRGKIINIRHGVDKDKAKFNFKYDSLTIASTINEFNFIKSNYKVDNYQLIGMPRYDNLVSNDKNFILLMPTFRKKNNYIKNFTETEYFEVYNNFINSPELDNLLNVYNKKLLFYPHYEVQKYLQLFNSASKNVEICSINEFDIQKLLIEASVLITDYSSVFFDFAYMKKPLIYYQFDYDEYRKSHYKEGFFNYENDGFGCVVKKQSSLLVELENILKYGIDKKYVDKVNSTFKYVDHNNCKRLYDKIMEL